jgi:hypothetical protein
MENEIELLNQTEADLLMLMQQYRSGQYTHIADCIRRVRVVRETLRRQTKPAPDAMDSAALVSWSNSPADTTSQTLSTPTKRR